jgi:hypothetical protein
MLRIPTIEPIIPEEQYVKKYTLGESLSASWQLGAPERIMNSIARSQAIDELQQKGTRLSPEEIKLKYGLTVDSPHTEQAAIYIKEAQEEKARLENIVANGPKSLFGGTIAPLVTQMISVSADPVDFTASVVTAGLFRAAAVGYKAYKVGATTSAAARVAGTTLIPKTKYLPYFQKAQLAADEIVLGRKLEYISDLASNVVSNSVAEVANYKATRKEQMELAADDVARNVLGTTFLMTSFFHGAGSVLSKILRNGGNSMGQLEELADLAHKGGKDVKTIMQIPIDALNKDLEIDDVLANSVRKLFPEHEEHLLQEGFTVTELREGLNDIDIPVEKMEEFLNDLQDTGWDMRKTYLFNDDPVPVLHPDTVKEIENAFNDPKNNIDYNPEIEKIVNETTYPDHLEPDEINILKENERLKQYDEIEVFSDEIKGDMALAKERIQESYTHIDAIKEFSACMGYIAKGIVNE